MTLSHADYQAIAAKLKPTGQAYIDGAYCDAADGQKFETTNPATGEVLAEVAHCKAADVDRAVAAAIEADGWLGLGAEADAAYIEENY